METYAITIARGFGTGGREIASKLADELGIHSYENRILTLAAQYSGMDEFEFREVDEKLRGSYVRSQIQRMQKRFLPQGHMNMHGNYLAAGEFNGFRETDISGGRTDQDLIFATCSIPVL